MGTKIEPTKLISLKEFISYWDNIAEDLKNRQIAKDDSDKILSNFLFARMNLILLTDGSCFSFTVEDILKIDLTKSKLETSLAIARSNYRSKHKSLIERLIDSISKIRLFGK